MKQTEAMKDNLNPCKELVRWANTEMRKWHPDLNVFVMDQWFADIRDSSWLFFSADFRDLCGRSA